MKKLSICKHGQIIQVTSGHSGGNKALESRRGGRIMIIYVVYYQVYDDVWIMDAFRSKKAAETAIENYPDDSDCYVIKETNLK